MMMSYQKSPIIDEDDTDVPLVTTILPPPTTMPMTMTMPMPTTMTRTKEHRLSKWMVAIVAGMIMMLVAYGAVLMLQDGSLYTTAAKDLVVATAGLPTPCLPAGGTFGGTSTTTWYGKSVPFETCYQLGDDPTYCWTKAWFSPGFGKYYQCLPDGGNDAWHDIDPKYVNPVTDPKSCGMPCHEVHQKGDDDFYVDDGYIPSNKCLPADGTFGGVSTTTHFGKSDPFQICYQLGDDVTYCWTNSKNCGFYMQCVPIGNTWHAIDARYVNPVTHPNSCGSPCQDSQ